MGQENFMLGQGLNNQFSGPGPEIYTDNTMSNMHMRNGSTDMGQAAQMAPPEIQVEFAPPSRNSSFAPEKQGADMDALIPPARKFLLIP